MRNEKIKKNPPELKSKCWKVRNTFLLTEKYTPTEIYLIFPIWVEFGHDLHFRQIFTFKIFCWFHFIYSPTENRKLHAYPALLSSMRKIFIYRWTWFVKRIKYFFHHHQTNTQTISRYNDNKQRNKFENKPIFQYKIENGRSTVTDERKHRIIELSTKREWENTTTAAVTAATR